VQRYRVQKYFQWGSLFLEKGQVIEIVPDEFGLRVNIAGQEKNILVGAGALQPLIKMGNIEEA